MLELTTGCVESTVVVLRRPFWSPGSPAE